MERRKKDREHGEEWEVEEDKVNMELWMKKMHRMKEKKKSLETIQQNGNVTMVCN